MVKDNSVVLSEIRSLLLELKQQIAVLEQKIDELSAQTDETSGGEDVTFVFGDEGLEVDNSSLAEKSYPAPEPQKEDVTDTELIENKPDEEFSDEEQPEGTLSEETSDKETSEQITSEEETTEQITSDEETSEQITSDEETSEEETSEEETSEQIISDEETVVDDDESLEQSSSKEQPEHQEEQTGDNKIVQAAQSQQVEENADEAKSAQTQKSSEDDSFAAVMARLSRRRMDIRELSQNSNSGQYDTSSTDTQDVTIENNQSQGREEEAGKSDSGEGVSSDSPFCGLEPGRSGQPEFIVDSGPELSSGKCRTVDQHPGKSVVESAEEKVKTEEQPQAMFPDSSLFSDSGLLISGDSPSPVKTRSRKKKNIADTMEVCERWRTDIPGTEVANIRSAITLYDRAQFMRVLFDSDPNLFQQTLTDLNAVQTLDEVLAYIKIHFPHWRMETDTVYKFMMAVRRKVRN